MNKRDLLRYVHIAASIIAFSLIALFLTSSVWAEMFAYLPDIVTTKRRIAWSLLLLIPAMALAGATGFAMAGKSPKGRAGTKALRMKIIAANGMVMLVPAAIFLAYRASRLNIDGIFWTVQMLEYMAGTTNLVLIGLNFGDGIRMSRARRQNIA